MLTIQTTYRPVFLPVAGKKSITSRFISWCTGQEQYRFGWLGAILAIHGCFLAPVTLFSIFLGGNNFVFWGLTIGAFTMALVTNLAAMPTKITIPVFFFSVLIDLVIVVVSLVNYFQL